jgi:Tol biopolymer transport system component
LPLSTGQRLGPYEIRAPLGAGGMGEVYRARDPRLERDVAIKVIPEHFVRDADSLTRFQTEARAIAALSHPNIVAVYDTGQEGDRLYVVTELLEGETLRDRLRAGPIGVRKAGEYAAQAAAGLAAAHERGIIHRDIKPENLFVTSEGRVKILDFGLAKQGPPIEGGEFSSSPTAAPPTSPGAMIGTVGYLAPEQARGDAVDHRADIFSLGAVLFEMLTGRRAFDGRSAAELLSSVLRDEPPPPSQTDPLVPKALDLIVLHCLEKRPDERFQSARDLAFHLGSLEGSVTQRGVVVPLPAPRRGRKELALGLAGLAAVAGAFAIGRWAGRAPAHDAAATAPLSFRQMTDLPGEERGARLGPAGTAFVYVKTVAGNADIYHQRVGGRNPINLTPDSPDADTTPAFSPDGAHVAFRSERDGGGIFVMGSTGESVRRLTTFGYDPAWSPDGTRIVFSSEDGSNAWSREGIGELSVVSVADGSVQRLPTAGDAVQPSWSPNGHRIAYWGLSGAGGQRDLWTIKAEAGGDPEAVRITEDTAVDFDPVWSPDGTALFFASERGGSMNLWRLAIDERSGQVLGEPRPLTTPSRISSSMSLSRDGSQLMYVSWDQRSTIQRLGLDPASGRVTDPPKAALRGSRVIYTHDTSPDGEWIAFSNQGVQEDLFVVRSDGTGYRQLTDDAFRDRGPRWSPDGEQIAFYSDRTGRYEIWSVKPDGSALKQLTKTTGESSPWLPEWSPDGKRIAVIDNERTWIADLTVPLEQRVPEPLPPVEGGHPLLPRSWSPDGRTLAGDLDFALTLRSVTLLYSFETKTYRAIAEGRGAPEWMSDSRRLVVAQHDRIVLLDTETGRTSTLVTASARDVSLSRDDRWLTWVEAQNEADVWLAVLEPADPAGAGPKDAGSP